MRFVFDGHQLDPDRRELRRGESTVAVEPQVLDLLLYLIRHRDRVISKDELITTVWNGRVVSDSTLASRINAARKAIGDDGQKQRLLRTYARKGVRFVGEVEEEPSAGIASVDAAETRRGKPTVAVLPFANLAADPAQDYISDGIAEDIITELSRNRSLSVIARSSTFGLRDARADVGGVVRDLGAAYLVQGSVRKAGERLRIAVQLAEAESGHQIWAERYDLPLQDLFSVQDEIASKIAGRIDPEVNLAEQARSARTPPRDFQAWDFFRLGTREFYKSSASSNEEAQRLFRRAIEMEPELAQAYGFLSYAMVLSMIYFDAEPAPAKLEEAVAIARRGTQIDDRDALIRFTYGRALLAQRRYGEALAELETARELNPSLAVVHCGLGDSLAYEGRIEESIPHFEAAIALSPHDPWRWAFYSYRALAHIFGGHYEAALQWASRAIRVPNCHYWAFAHRVAAEGHLGRGDAAAEAVTQLLERKPSFSLPFARRRLFYVKDPGHLERYLAGLRRAGIPAN